MDKSCEDLRWKILGEKPTLAACRFIDTKNDAIVNSEKALKPARQKGKTVVKKKRKRPTTCLSLLKQTNAFRSSCNSATNTETKWIFHELVFVKNHWNNVVVDKDLSKTVTFSLKFASNKSTFNRKKPPWLTLHTNLYLIKFISKFYSVFRVIFSIQATIDT